jgi:hypothetical protein
VESLKRIKYIHGSEDSLDVDVFYVFDKLPTFRECQEFCSDKEENRNIIVVKNGVVIDCYKGTIDEINNGLIDTYQLHKQDYNNIVIARVERDVLIKAIRVVRCLLSHCSRTQYRTEVKTALRSPSWKVKLNTLKSIKFDEIEDYGKSGTKEDVYKVFAFQLGQVLGLFDGYEFYTKSSIANKHELLKKYLYREKNSDVTDLISYIYLFLEEVSQFEVEEVNGIVHFKDFEKNVDLVKEIYI